MKTYLVGKSNVFGVYYFIRSVFNLIVYSTAGYSAFSQFLTSHIQSLKSLTGRELLQQLSVFSFHKLNKWKTEWHNSSGGPDILSFVVLKQIMLTKHWILYFPQCNSKAPFIRWSLLSRCTLLFKGHISSLCAFPNNVGIQNNDLIHCQVHWGISDFGIYK